MTCVGADLSSEGRATSNSGLDLMYVRTKLSGPSGPVVQLVSVVAKSSSTVLVTWNVRRYRRFIQGYHVRWRQAATRPQARFTFRTF